MKRFGLYLTGLFLSVLCLTSCLKGNNVQEGWALGVLELGGKNSFTPVLRTTTGDFYATELASKINNGEIYFGDCFVIYYRLDSDLPENGASVLEVNGYYTITILQIGQLKKYNLNPYLTDISTIRPNEMPVLNGYFGGEYVDNHLFITQIVNQQSDLELHWEMSYDGQNIVTVDENNKRYYDLYIRAIVATDSEKTLKSDVQYTNVYYMGNYFSYAASNEKAYLGSNFNASTSKFTIRFNYVADIDEETNTITWKSSEVEDLIAWFTE